MLSLKLQWQVALDKYTVADTAVASSTSANKNLDKEAENSYTVRQIRKSQFPVLSTLLAENYCFCLDCKTTIVPIMQDSYLTSANHKTTKSLPVDIGCQIFIYYHFFHDQSGM